MDVHRRTFLGTAGGVGFALAGCVGLGGTNETVGVTVENQDSATRKITVTVAYDGRTLLEQTMTVGPSERVGAPFENPDTAGEADVTVRSVAGRETSSSVRVGPGTGIRSITVVLSEDGTLSVRGTRT